MKQLLIIIALLSLTACATEQQLQPDPKTPAGSRYHAIVQAEQIAAAVRTAQSVCTVGQLEQCVPTLSAQENLVRKIPELHPSGGRPAACDLLVSDYTILKNSALDYFKQMQLYAAGSAANFAQTALERMVSFNQSYTAFNRMLATDSTCR